MSEYKHLIFFACLFLGVPIGFFLALHFTLFERLVFFLTTFFTCSLQGSINFISNELYRGTSRGFEVTAVDLLALVLFLLVVSRNRRFKVEVFPPGTCLYGLYCLLSAISIVNADEPLYSGFELWKMARMYFLYWVFYNYLQDMRQIAWLFRFAAVIIGYIFLVTFYQKYGQGLYQCRGPFPHQNSLVMYMILFNSLVFAKLLNYQESLMKTCFTFALWTMGCGCVVATLSRAGMACYGVSCLLVFTLSFYSGARMKDAVLGFPALILWPIDFIRSLRRFKINSRLVVVFMLLIVTGIAGVAKSFDSIVRRLATAPVQSKLTRLDLARSATNMANDKFLGVGLNNFGLKVNRPYHYSDHIKRRDPLFKEGLVETTYLMIAAETGWLNLLVFLGWLSCFFLWNLRNFINLTGVKERFFALGLVGGLTGVYLESTLEWVLKQTNNFYQLMIVFAVIAAMGRLIKHARRTSRANNAILAKVAT